MLVCGCDFGSATGKAVLMKNDRILSWSVAKSTISPEKTAVTVLYDALRKAGITSMDEVGVYSCNGIRKRKCTIYP